MIYNIIISFIVILLTTLFFHIATLYKKIQHINETITLINEKLSSIDKKLDKESSLVNNEIKKNNIIDENLYLDDTDKFNENIYVNINKNSLYHRLDFNDYFVPKNIKKLNIICEIPNQNNYKNGIYFMNDKYVLINSSKKINFNFDELNLLDEIKISFINNETCSVDYEINFLLFNNVKYLTFMKTGIVSLIFDEFININTDMIILNGNINMDYFKFIKCFVNLKNIKITNVKKMRMEQIKNNIEEQCKKKGCILEFI
jgi:hypothetical protein